MNRTTKINVLAYASRPEMDINYFGDIVEYQGKRYFVSLCEEVVEFRGIVKESGTVSDMENVVLASPEQMEFIIEGMRNPMNSWEKSDSERCKDIHICNNCLRYDDCLKGNVPETELIIGENDFTLMQRLSKAGTDHRKYMRMMPVYVRITAPLYWWKEFDTYKVGTVANSCSTMHKITEKEFTLEDFSTEHLKTGSIICLNDIIDELNKYRDKFINFDSLGYSDDIYDSEQKTEIKKDIWWQMIQLLPSSYNQTRNVMMNYEVLVNIYKSRKDHKLDEWREFCRWIESLPYSELITVTNDRMKMTKDDICEITDYDIKGLESPEEE